MQKDWLTIGQASSLTGLSAKMLRHYESRGLLQPGRSPSGYRLYPPGQLAQLQLIYQARQLGFSLAQVEALLALWQQPDRASRDVQALAQQQLALVTEKIRQLQQLQQQLQNLVAHCAGDDTPDCSILRELSGQAD
ncbi:MAG: MerR family DNA-binding protein [Rheinheimera sp.]|nr:MerR family DNA-binding protein [Rheinheimera sp.]